MQPLCQACGYGMTPIFTDLGYGNPNTIGRTWDATTSYAIRFDSRSRFVNMDIPQIDAAAARSLLDQGGATFIDIRDPRSFQAGRIQGALHITDHNVMDFVAATDRDRPVIVCCYHGNTSLDATAWLLEQGFQQVSSLIGGFEGWRVLHPDAIDRS